MVKMLNAAVAHRITDFIDFHVGLDQQLLSPFKPQVVEIADKGAAALLGKAGTEIFLAETHIVGHRFEHQLRVGEVVLHKLLGPLDGPFLQLLTLAVTGVPHPAQGIPQPDFPLSLGYKFPKKDWKIRSLWKCPGETQSVALQPFSQPGQQNQYLLNMVFVVEALQAAEPAAQLLVQELLILSAQGGNQSITGRCLAVVGTDQLSVLTLDTQAPRPLEDGQLAQGFTAGGGFLQFLAGDNGADPYRRIQIHQVVPQALDLPDYRTHRILHPVPAPDTVIQLVTRGGPGPYYHPVLGSADLTDPAWASPSSPADCPQTAGKPGKNPPQHTTPECNPHLPVPSPSPLVHSMWRGLQNEILSPSGHSAAVSDWPD